MIFDLELDSVGRFTSQNCIDGAILAEAQGFGGIWKGESNTRDAMVLLSAVAARTTTLQLGIGIYHVFGRSPVSLAIQAATLNELSTGRLMLGLGIANSNIAGWHGEAFAHPLRRIREYLQVLRLAYSGQKVEYSGSCFKVSGFRMAFKPQIERLSIWLAGLGPQTAHLAGELSDGLIINLANPPMIRRIIENFHQGASDASRDATSLGVSAKVRVSINRDVEKAKVALRRVVASYALAYGYRDMFERMGWSDVVYAVQEGYRRGGLGSAGEQIPDEMLEDLPTIAAPSFDAANSRLQPYLHSGLTRCTLAYVVSGDDAWSEGRELVKNSAVFLSNSSAPAVSTPKVPPPSRFPTED
jgi:probable F420-dependent oxidoreductase